MKDCITKSDTERFLSSVASRGKEKMKVKWPYYECEGEWRVRKRQSWGLNDQLS